MLSSIILNVGFVLTRSFNYQMLVKIIKPVLGIEALV